MKGIPKTAFVLLAAIGGIFQEETQTPMGSQITVEYTLTTQDAEGVTVPAGTYPALRVEATDGGSSIVFLVRAAPPHRVLAVEPPGGPLRLVRLGPR